MVLRHVNTSKHAVVHLHKVIEAGKPVSLIVVITEQHRCESATFKKISPRCLSGRKHKKGLECWLLKRNEHESSIANLGVLHDVGAHLIRIKILIVTPVNFSPFICA